MKKNHKIGLIITGISVFIFIVLIVFKPKSTLNPPEEKTWPINTIIIKKSTNIPNILLFGTIQTPKLTNLESSITADVIKTHANTGDLVNKNQLLISLDPKDIELLLEQRKADLSEIDAIMQEETLKHIAQQKMIEHEKHLIKLKEKSLKRQTTLELKHVASKLALDNAKAALHQQKLALIQSQLQIDNYSLTMTKLKAKKQKVQALHGITLRDLNRTKIISPFNGRITNLNVAVGNKAKPGDQLIELYDINKLEVRTLIPLAYVNQIQKSITEQKRLIAKSDSMQEPLILTLSRLSGHIDKGRGGLDAYFTINNANTNLAIGKIIELVLTLSPIHNSFKLPNTAIYDNHRIYRVVDNRLQMVKIKKVGSIYQTNKTETIITSDKLSENDQILSIYIPNARTSLKVKILNSQNEKQ